MASLEQHSEVLGKRLAAHLLRRATYHINPRRVEAFAEMTPNQAVNQLFQMSSLAFPDGPLSWNNGKPLIDLTDEEAGEVAKDDSLFDKKARPGNAVVSWLNVEAMADESIKFKIIIFFSTLFIVNTSPTQQRTLYFWLLLDRMTESNLKTLALKMTLDHTMMRYLDNHLNSGNSPNENYAREFFELFTILKGKQISETNLTNYTEEDIIQAAGVLSGFRANFSTIDEDTGLLTSSPSFRRHKAGDKTFSSAFNFTTIRGASNARDMNRELEDFVQMVFDQQETARAYVRRMYRFFVNDIIDEEIERDIIEPLSIQLKDNGYQHLKVLKTLMKSKHFYDLDDADSKNENIGAKIKSPLDLLWQSVCMFEVKNKKAGDYDFIFNKDYGAYRDFFTKNGMPPHGPPTVEGFQGYYKEPSYSRFWFANNFLFPRFSIGQALLTGKRIGGKGNFPFKLDLVQWVSNHIDNVDGAPGSGPPDAFNPIGASDANRVVNLMLSYLVPEMPTGTRYDYFLDTLLGGLSPINWYFAWRMYIEGENDDSDVRIGLERLFLAILASPEYQTF